MKLQALGLLSGAAFVLAASPSSAPSGLLIPTSTGRPDAAVLSLRDMTIDASVARGYARVNVRQIFANHTEASYQTPSRAIVCRARVVPAGEPPARWRRV